MAKLEEDEKFHQVMKEIVSVNPSVDTSHMLIAALYKHIAWKRTLNQSLEFLKYGERN